MSEYARATARFAATTDSQLQAEANAARRTISKMTCRMHRDRHLRFSTDTPDNQRIVDYFFGCFSAGNGRVTADEKCYAIGEWGWTNALAGMFRAARKYRRLTW